MTAVTEQDTWDAWREMIADCGYPERMHLAAMRDLSREDLLCIRIWIDSGIALTEVARGFGVSVGFVRKVRADPTLVEDDDELFPAPVETVEVFAGTPAPVATGGVSPGSLVVRAVVAPPARSVPVPLPPSRRAPPPLAPEAPTSEQWPWMG